ncbi:hypothetical protein Emag_002381 [Eimeria magna]
MEVEGRLSGLRQLPASQLLRAGLVDHRTTGEAAVEEFSNSSPVNRPAFKQTGTHPWYVWEAVLSLTAALTIVFVLRKCFLTLSQAADTHKLRGSISKGEGSVRHLSEGDAGQCDSTASKGAETPGHTVTSNDDGNEGDAVKPTGDSASLGAVGDASLGDEAASGHGSDNPDASSRKTLSSATSENSLRSWALRLICCAFPWRLEVYGKRVPQNLAGLSPEVYGFYRGRSSSDSRTDGWAGVYEGSNDSLASTEKTGPGPEKNSGADGRTSTKVPSKGTEESSETEGKDKESDGESGPPDVPNEGHNAIEDGKDKTGSANSRDLAAEGAAGAGEVDGEKEDGERKNESGKETDFVKEGATGETGMSKHFLKNPNTKGRKRIGNSPAGRLARAYVLARNNDLEGTSSGSPEDTQVDETAGGEDET